MTLSGSDLFIESLTLPGEDPALQRRLYDRWQAAYPGGDPIEQGFIEQAIRALVEKRRIARGLATLRTDRLRTADLFFEREQEDYIAKSLPVFNTSCEWGMRAMTRTAAGCRWCIELWLKLQVMLTNQGTLYGQHSIDAIRLLGQSAVLDELCYSEEAFTFWLDCLAAQPNPKQKDINRVLDPLIVPKALRDRELKLWPRDAGESRARLHSIAIRELAWLRALEETLRLQYEIPARAEAQAMALATITKQETSLLRAGRICEQSYERATAALIKARMPRARSGRAAVAVRDESMLVVSFDDPPPVVRGPEPAPEPQVLVPYATEPPVVCAHEPAPPSGPDIVVGRSEHRTFSHPQTPLGEQPWSNISANRSTKQSGPSRLRRKRKGR